MKKEIFTPMLNGERVEFNKEDVEVISGNPLEDTRELWFRWIVKIKDKQYNVVQIPCSLPNCNCNKKIIEI